MKQKGILIALEGGEGAGKTTQLERLTKQFNKIGKNIISVREPGGTIISEQIRTIVLSNKNTGMKGITEVLLFQAARAQIYSEIVIPALKAGKIVLMDRTRDSSVVYQGMVRGFGRKLVEQLNDISTQETEPDLTILLDVDVKIGLGRRNGTGNMNRLDLENGSFHRKVRSSYLKLAKENQNNRWVIINANQTEDEVEKALWKVLRKRFKLYF